MKFVPSVRVVYFPLFSRDFAVICFFREIKYAVDERSLRFGEKYLAPPGSNFYGIPQKHALLLVMILAQTLQTWLRYRFSSAIAMDFCCCRLAAATDDVIVRRDRRSAGRGPNLRRRKIDPCSVFSVACPTGQKRRCM
jgi:hypothetical protein